MKKVSFLLSFLLVLVITHSAYSLPDFMYSDIAYDVEGEIIASPDWETDVYINLRLSLYEGDDMVFQQGYESSYVDQFGYFNVWFGRYWDEAETLWVDISDIRATAELRIKVELYDRGAGWYTVAFKQISEAIRGQGRFDQTLIKAKEDPDANSSNNIEKAKDVLKNGDNLNRNNTENPNNVNSIVPPKKK